MVSDNRHYITDSTETLDNTASATLCGATGVFSLNQKTNKPDEATCPDCIDLIADLAHIRQPDQVEKNGQAVGYIRVSSVDQKLDRQLVDLDLDRIFQEKRSGKDTNRPELKACLAYLRQGDTLHVHSIDRLARNLADLDRIVRDLLDRGIVVIFHKEALTFAKDNPFQKLQLHLIGAVAEFERALIRERQREGIAIAKAKGKRLGRKPALDDDQVEAVRELISAGGKIIEIAKMFGVNKQTIYRIKDKMEN